MNEFELIDAFFSSILHSRTDVLLGIGDDAACLHVPADKQLLVSTDTLVAGVHFLPEWDPYDIATKAVMVNISDIAAMAGVPAWMTLALTLPELNEHWLSRFASGLKDALSEFNVALVGGDTTRGPLSMTLTVHGLADKDKVVTRQGAKANDIIYVSGPIGAAAAALKILHHGINPTDFSSFMRHLHKPTPRVDYQPYLAAFANAAIDISDGLSNDLNHICTRSGVGASLILDDIPIHPLVYQYQSAHALELALSGGDDYELCFTVPKEKNNAFLNAIAHAGLKAYPIGVVEPDKGVYAKNSDGVMVSCTSQGYHHF